MSDVVTGEAVVVEVRVAQLPSRAAALLIDMAAQLMTLFGASLLIGLVAPQIDTALAMMIYIVFTVFVLVGYPVIFETLSRGRSLGKLALGLRVVADDGGPERFRQALFRGLAGMLEIWTLSGAPALISSLISERGKRLGDVFAGTMVISERAPRQYGPPLEMPPQLASWAAGLELSRLPEEVSATARQYLTRWHDLAPAVRHEMGTRIAAEMSAFVSPPPPPGVPPFAYLTAVLAERRRRDHIRLAWQAGAARDAGGPVPYGPHLRQAHTPYSTEAQAPFAPPYSPAPPPSPQPFYPPQSYRPAPAPGPVATAPQAPPVSSPVSPPVSSPMSPPAPAETEQGATPGGFVPPA